MFSNNLLSNIGPFRMAALFLYFRHFNTVNYKWIPVVGSDHSANDAMTPTQIYYYIF